MVFSHKNVHSALRGIFQSMVWRVVRRCLKRSGKSYDPAAVKKILVKLGKLAFRAFQKDSKTLFLTKVSHLFVRSKTEYFRRTLRLCLYKGEYLFIPIEISLAYNFPKASHNFEMHCASKEPLSPGKAFSHKLHTKLVLVGLNFVGFLFQ